METPLSPRDRQALCGRRIRQQLRLHGLACRRHDRLPRHAGHRQRPGQRQLRPAFASRMAPCSTPNWGAMGWDLPLAIGACVGGDRRRTVCVTGDGSIQLNSHELTTISHYDLPIKVFVFNNAGYATIRATQRNLFEGRLVASGPAGGVDSPTSASWRKRRDCPTRRSPQMPCSSSTSRMSWLSPAPRSARSWSLPIRRSSRSHRHFGRKTVRSNLVPLEDMAPFLPRDEVWRNMHLFDDDAGPVVE